jgi:hypothetical protein
VKNTNVSTIGKKYLKLRGYHNTEIYGSPTIQNKGYVGPYKLACEVILIKMYHTIPYHTIP